MSTRDIVLAAAGGTGTAVDPYFKNVSLLLHGDGTNGGQNNTFIDSSSNNFTITRNGNTTQGSFSPYGTLWSNYFNGTSDRLSISNTTQLDLGTGDFTLECWMNSVKAPADYTLQYAHLFGKGNSSTAGTWALGYYAGNVYFGIGSGGSVSGATTLAAGTWYHIAVTRSGSTVRVFVNGTQDGSGTLSTNATSTASFNIGDRQASDPANNYPFAGYISNIRVVKGTALYTSNFTPSTTPLTAVSGTTLLTSQSNRFIDNSSNNLSITSAGLPSVQRLSPFAPTAAYSTSVIGGSGYFDGNGDYINTPVNSAFTFGTGNFCVECWFYVSDSGTSRRDIIGNYSNVTAGWGVALSVSNSFDILFYAGNSTIISTSGSVWNPSCWNHLAISRSGTTVRLFLNGNQITSATDSTSINNGSNYTFIGATGNYSPSPPSSAQLYFAGYLSDTRVVNGSAVYTSNFTPPTSPLSAITNTVFLCNFINGAIFDNAMMNDLETVGNAQISTSVVKYGTGSLYFDGTGDYLLTPYAPQFNLGAGNFTIEAWVYSQAEGGKYFICLNGDGYAQVAMAVYGTAKIEVDISTSANSWAIVYSSPTNSFPLNQWNHVALVRNGSAFTLYINGTGYSVGTNSSALYNYAKPTLIGSGSTTSYNFQGYVDEVRITNGIARYTSNFTPPTAAFPNQ